MLFNLFDTEDAPVASHAAATNTNNTNTKAKNQTSKRSQVKNACGKLIVLLLIHN